MAAAKTFSDGRFSTPQVCAPRRVVLPFRTQGDLTSQLIEIDYVILASSFASAGVAKLDTPLPGSPGFFLVEQTDPRPVELGLVQFTRVFAKLPESRNDYEGYVFTPPAERTAALSQHVFRVPFFFDDLRGHMNTPNGSGLILPSDAEITQREWLTHFTTSVVDGNEVITSTTPFTRWHYQRPWNYALNAYVDASAWGQYVGRPFSISSRVAYTYHHTIAPSAIPRVQTQLQVDAQGNYMIGGAGTERCIEPTVISRWRGNIWQAKTRYGVVD